MFVVAITVLSAPTRAQDFTPNAGYFPDCYHGDAFSGVLTAADDNTGEITLTYSNPKNGKQQTLVGHIEKKYTVRSRVNPAAHLLRASELSLGTTYTAYYCTASEKVNGTKTKIRSIFSIEGVPNLAVYRLMYMAF